MPWIQFDDGFMDHPAVAALTHGGFRLWVGAIAYSGRLLTDGLVPERSVPRLIPDYEPAYLDELIGAGRLHRPDHACTSPLCGPVPAGSVLVHDYLGVQRSKAQVLADRAAAAERQRRRRGVSHGVTPPVTNGVSHTTHSTPLPSEGGGSGTRASTRPELRPVAEILAALPAHDPELNAKGYANARAALHPTPDDAA